ncbi:MAG: hypothetical protein M3680_05780, partial [Myxococcota bacterium]|nr:hypothetical protein [Myxococcota bacterium]
APVSQPRALVLALGGVGRMVVPCLGAIAAVLIGGLALVIPGLVLLVLLSLTGASEARGMPAPLTESVAIVRSQLGFVAAIVAAMIVLDLAIALGAWKLVAAPLVKQLPAAGFATYRDVVRVVAAALVVVSPVLATVLASVRATADQR